MGNALGVCGESEMGIEGFGVYGGHQRCGYGLGWVGRALSG